MKFDSVVVGGGVSGLSAALILARQGRKVAVVEKSTRLAPLIRGFTRHGRYFDSAFHYAGGLGEGDTLDLFFRYLGLSERLEKHPFNPEGFDLFRDTDDGREFRFPAGFVSLRKALCEAFPSQRPAIVDYLALLQGACSLLPYLDPEIPADRWDGSAVIHGPSLAEVLDRLTSHQPLKNLLSLHTILHGVVPTEVPFAIHASVTALYYRSPFGITGGGRSLARAFEEQLMTAGVVPILGRAVKNLRLSPAGRLAGIDLADGEQLDCSECLVSTHPGHFLDMIPQNALKPAFRKRLQSLEDTTSAFILYAACAKPSSVLNGSNLILGRLAATDAHWNGKLGARTLFVAANSTANQSSPPGWVAICPARWQEFEAWSEPGRKQRKPGYLEEKERVAAEILAQVCRQAPELADQAAVLETASPLTLRDYTGSPIGGLYGVKQKVGQYNPQPRVRIPGVYLTGQAAAAPGVLGAMTSAFLTCGHLFGHEKLRKEVLACR